jgi:quinoprotein glucose dehydrogenase
MSRLSLAAALLTATVVVSGAGKNWDTYLGDKARTHYSTLTQITKRNVSSLKVAWTYDTGDKGEFEANPLIVDSVLYTVSSTRKVIALNAANGAEIWKWDPATIRPGGGNPRQRGITYWADGADRRIFTGAGQYLYALNARNGQLVKTFGENGSILLGTGTEREPGSPPSAITLNTPGMIYKDMFIAGGNTNDEGSIRAFDVRTGRLRWIFHTIPRPGEYGYDTWPPDGYKRNGAVSNWTGTALDEARGILYVPTEAATPDFWGANRTGDGLFSTSLIALDANTGTRLWHYQIVHHDIWDRDLPTPPVLLTVTHNGRRVDVVAQGTKQGLLFVFNRVTGEPLWPIEERPVPQSSEIAEEHTSPTQPFPTLPPPLMRQIYTADDVSNISPEAALLTSTRFKQAGSSGPYPAPTLKEKIFFPGYDGGMEWGGAAADPEGIYYANLNEVPWFYSLVSTRRADGSRVPLGERVYVIQCGACHGLDRQGDRAGGFPSLVDIKARRTKEQIHGLLNQGGGRMPSFASLSEPQRRAIGDFLYGEEQPDRAYAESGRGPGAPPTGDDLPYAFQGFRRWLDAQGYPAIRPPWGTLNAVDLNTGQIKWRVPVGEYAELTAKGIPPTGTENYGGPMLTATGLLFIGATADGMFRAFDKDTGRVLWSSKLPFGGNATPSTYLANGKQYVAISGGHALFVFTLSD